jgi:phage protein D
MPEPVSIISESQTFGNFRVPQYKVVVEGVDLPGNVVRDVMQLTYKDNLKDIDGFELTVNNWDATGRRFKFAGGGSDEFHDLFEPSNKKFEIQMGYVNMNPLRTMVLGSFTTLEPNFPSSGASTLNGRGLNVLHKLRTKQYTDKYPHHKPSEIAREISHKTDPETNKKRFPIPIHVDDFVLSHEHYLEYMSQRNQYDIDFLFQLARKVGYVLYLSPDQQTLFFGPSTSDSPQALREVTYILKWGATLVDFKPTMNAANQVKSVTVRGHTRGGQRVSAKVTLTTAEITINRDLLPILQQCYPREEVVVDEPVASEAQARDRALAILLERYKEFVTATGTTLGLPDLRAGMQVQIDGVDSRFNGRYFVTESTHTINDSGYLTKFTARREDTGGGSGAG